MGRVDIQVQLVCGATDDLVLAPPVEALEGVVDLQELTPRTHQHDGGRAAAEQARQPVAGPAQRILGQLEFGDVAPDAPIPQHASLCVEERPATDLEVVELAVVRPTAAVAQAAERSSCGQFGTMPAPEVRVGGLEPPFDLPACFANQLDRHQAGVHRDALANRGESALGIGFPVPIGGGFGEVAKAFLAFTQQGFRPLDLADVLNRAQHAQGAPRGGVPSDLGEPVQVAQFAGQRHDPELEVERRLALQRVHMGLPEGLAVFRNHQRHRVAEVDPLARAVNAEQPVDLVGQGVLAGLAVPFPAPHVRQALRVQPAGGEARAGWRRGRRQDLEHGPPATALERVDGDGNGRLRARQHQATRGHRMAQLGGVVQALQYIAPGRPMPCQACQGLAASREPAVAEHAVRGRIGPDQDQGLRGVQRRFQRTQPVAREVGDVAQAMLGHVQGLAQRADVLLVSHELLRETVGMGCPGAF